MSTPAKPDPASIAAARGDDSVIEYPCDFPIKVMGPHEEAFVEEIVVIAARHDPVFDRATRLTHRPSSSGTYIGLTLTIRATSRAQLDDLYRALTGHPRVKYVL